MELRQRVLRQAAKTVAGRAVEAISHDPRRGLRSLVDLAACWANTPGQRATLALAQDALAPTSRYYHLASRAAAQVARPQLEALAQAAVTSLGYGMEELRQGSRRMGLRLPWCILLERPLPPGAHLLEDAQKLGCHLFLLQNQTVRDICATALRAPESFFVAVLRAKQLGTPGVHQLCAAPNLAVSVELRPGSGPWEALERLRESGCLFGGHLRQDGQLVDPVRERAFQEQLGQAGCLFLCYLLPTGQGQSPAAQALALDRARGRSSLLPLLPCRDLALLAKSLSPGVPLLRVSPELPLLAQLRGLALQAKQAAPQGTP